MTSISFANVQKEMERLFSRFDHNGDGKISLCELHLLMKTIGEELCCEEAKVFLQHAELDDDGLLDMEDFMRLLEWKLVRRRKSNQEYMVGKAFKLYEMKGRSFITDRSLKRMLSRLGLSRPIEQCRSMIFSFDLNGDGVLCFDEFKATMMLCSF